MIDVVSTVWFGVGCVSGYTIFGMEECGNEEIRLKLDRQNALRPL